MHVNDVDPIRSPAVALRRRAAVLLLACAGWGASAAAHAAACDAPWMHAGGGFSLTSSPTGMTTQVTVLDFRKTAEGDCSGTVQARTEASIGGQKMNSQSRMTLRVTGNHARFESTAAAGSMSGTAGQGTMTGSISTQTSGLLTYVGESLDEGASLPGTRTESSFSGGVAAMGAKVGQIQAPKIVLTTTAKQVGKAEQLDTAVGKLRCVPISYDRTQQVGNMTAFGHAGGGTATTHVVDHFCSGTGLVMRSDFTTNGKHGSVTVSALH
ncbi:MULTISPECIES: hypothetical protein [Burkholderia]|uniref:hypothetical protein n=1 Tax=Burkholderia TaxID=32008 RepID=UPI000C005F00|nr:MULTISPECIES: hypothetical protein [Burkholderia]PFH20995.1 hypothetical protein BX604_5420 [Burkholderia sp. JKS000303]